MVRPVSEITSTVLAALTAIAATPVRQEATAVGAGETVKGMTSFARSMTPT